MAAHITKFNWPIHDKTALMAMFNEARAKNLWFYHGGLSGPLWLSPNELQSFQEKGEYRWGASNWQLRDPQERLYELEVATTKLLTERKEFERRMVQK